MKTTGTIANSFFLYYYYYCCRCSTYSGLHSETIIANLTISEITIVKARTDRANNYIKKKTGFIKINAKER